MKRFWPLWFHEFFERVRAAVRAPGLAREREVSTTRSHPVDPELPAPSRPLRTRCTICTRDADSLLVGPTLPDRSHQSLPACTEHGDRVRDILFEEASEVWPQISIVKIHRPSIH